MALFEYFPNNYVWNLSLAIAMASGAEIGELMDMCKPLAEAARGGTDAGTGAFLREWVHSADNLIDLAQEDQERKRLLSAGTKLQRAALYLLIAERMQGTGSEERIKTFKKAQSAFQLSTELGHINCERLEIPYREAVLPALFVQGEGSSERLPCVLYVNGLDSCKEMLFWTGLPRELARRGISTLCLDQPGTGESLRLHGLPGTARSEEWASPAFEFLARRADIDPTRIGMAGISLGGHFTPRAMAFEPRFASGAVWGANHNWAEVQQKRLRREGENPVPHYWNHVMWVFGAKDMPEFHSKTKEMHLNGILDRIKAPFLVTHGAADRQISIDYAQQTYDQLTASTRRELKVFTAREGGVEHVGADNMTFGRDYIADWFAETLGGSSRGQDSDV